MWFRSQDRLVPARLWWGVQAPNSFLFVLTARAHRTSSCAPIGRLKAYSVPCSNQYRSRRPAVSSVAWAVVLPSANPSARSRFEIAQHSTYRPRDKGGLRGRLRTSPAVHGVNVLLWHTVVTTAGANNVRPPQLR